MKTGTKGIKEVTVTEEMAASKAGLGLPLVLIQAMERYRVFNSEYEHDAAIRLIALDLDGTTMNSDNMLPDEDRKMLEAAIANGVNVVVASGR